MKLKQAQGNWVAGPKRFWNREHEVELFIEALDEGAHLHLVAQRRIGKTSLMREVSRRIEDRYACLHLDLQKATSAEDLITELSKATHHYQSLWDKTKEVFENILRESAGRIESLQIDEVTLKIREGLLGGNWPSKGDRLLEALAASDQPVVIFMDEVPILVNRILKGSDFKMTPDRKAAADQLLSWLRENSIRHKGKVRFVVTGSIGFEPILRQAGLSATINNFRAIDLRPWDAQTAIGCLEALANRYGVDFEDRACQRMTELLGSCIPHHVQMFFTHVYESGKRRDDMRVTSDDVDRVYNSRMLSTRGHAELSTFEERLIMMVGHDSLPFVLDLLTEAAVVGRLTEEAIGIYCGEHGLGDREGTAETREVIDILEHDGYLTRTSDAYVFTSNLVRDWWKRRFGALGFQPAAKRIEHR